jgi:hypothetical protein
MGRHCQRLARKEQAAKLILANYSAVQVEKVKQLFGGRWGAEGGASHLDRRSLQRVQPVQRGHHHGVLHLQSRRERTPVLPPRGSSTARRLAKERWMTKEVFVDVYDVLPHITIDYQNYWQSERDVINPALIAAGYQVGPWFTADGDSFGPLVRATRANDPDGRLVTISYG